MKRFRGLIITLLLCLNSTVLSARAEGTPPGAVTHPIHVVGPVTGLRANVGHSPPYVPADIRSAYGFNNSPALNYLGDGQVIAIVDAYGDANIQSDLATFCSTYNLPAPSSSNFQVLFPNGQPTSSDDDWALETALDVEWARAIAPNATIYLVVAQSNSGADLYAAVQYAAALGARVISMSWGGGEYSGELSNDSAYFGQSNTVYVASSGDYGEGVQYPAASPNVLSVGGTSLTLNSDGSVQSETAWSGSGGGPSSYEPLPDYQSVFGLTGLTSGSRAVPDVALVADPNTGVRVYCTQGSYTGWNQVGGTSLSAPAWAGLIAILDQVRGAPFSGQQVQEMLYNLAGTQTAYNSKGLFRDITSGSNGYSAGPGYDLVTGIGAPLVDKLVQTIIASLPAISGLSPSSGPAGTQVTISGTNFGATRGASTVNLNGVPIAQYSWWSAGQVVCQVPSGATSGPLTVKTAAGLSNSRTFTVANLSSPTTTLGSNHNPSTYGQSITLTATLTPSGAPGTVNFFDGGAILGSSTISGGVATFSTSSLGAGSHSIATVYGGDTNYSESASQALIQVVNKAATSSVVSSNLNPSSYGQSVTFTAKVTPSTATGTFNFLDGATSPGSSTISGGAGSFSISALKVGSHTITAAYSGDGNFDASTSHPLTQTIGLRATHFKVTAVQSWAYTGARVQYAITALDAHNKVADNYKGAVSIGSREPGFAVDTTTIANSPGSFFESFTTPGKWSVTATDASNSRLKGQSQPVSIYLPAIKYLVAGPTRATVGKPVYFRIKALNEKNRAVPVYSGRATLASSTDPTVSAPAAAFTKGVGKFSVTFEAAGAQTVTVTDSQDPSITGTANIAVRAIH
ncbi:MAG: Ig-like domain repeat protein [Syntrophobacteraceae bacterium]|nr:Ig-like domain repeat protein [Syntrophobacteraceae bacterium]